MSWGTLGKAQDLQQIYEKTPVYTNFTGKPGEQHRVFLFNADTWKEQQVEPWKSCAEWDGTAEVMVKWLLTNKGNSDVLWASDGRSRLIRRKLDGFFDNARHLHENWVVFKPDSRVGRKLAFSADNKEAIVVSMPLNRSQLSTQKRDSFNSAGEESTHETSYTGVESIPWGALPLLNAADKEKILGYPSAMPPASASKQGFDASLGLPLFWTERKGPQVWKQLLLHLNAGSVFDLTPGSGQCARACMEMGIPYACTAKNAAHGSWLINVLDRMALAQICKHGSALFQQDLSECLREHFGETLDQLNEQDQAVETSILDENEA